MGVVATLAARRTTGGFAVAAGLAAMLCAQPPVNASSSANAANAIAETLAGTRFDFSAGVVEIEETGAADLHAPNAQVARVAAERTARMVAARRLSAVLAALPSDRLGCRVPTVENVRKATDTAPPKFIEWSSDGSVSLTLSVPFAALLQTTHEDAPATVTEAGPRVILVDAKIRPTVFRTLGNTCLPAPRHFPTVADARAQGGDLATAEIAFSHAATTPARVIAVVRSDEKRPSNSPAKNSAAP